jgi:hypothetical protein
MRRLMAIVFFLFGFAAISAAQAPSGNIYFGYQLLPHAAFTD